MPQEQKPPRRKFFSTSIKAVIGFFTVAFGVPLTGFFISPVLKKDEGEWLDIADVSQVKTDEPSKITYHSNRKDGWMTSQTSRTVFVRKRTDGSVAIWSNRCTHLGCAVDWSTSSNHFTCPCHGGIFNIDGDVVEGPPPRPLAQLECKVENDRIFIKEV